MRCLGRQIPSSLRSSRNSVCDTHYAEYRWNIILYSRDAELSHSFVFAEEFLLELKTEHFFLVAYIIPD